jgi:hypothetical protein
MCIVAVGIMMFSCRALGSEPAAYKLAFIVLFAVGCVVRVCVYVCVCVYWWGCAGVKGARGVGGGRKSEGVKAPSTR